MAGVFTGNDRGADNCIACRAHALFEERCAIPLIAQTCWVGDAGLGARNLDQGTSSTFIKRLTKLTIRNLTHLAYALKANTRFFQRRMMVSRPRLP